MVKVKICGITNLEDALLASGLGADALGFIFTKKSPRYIKEEAARKIISQLDPFVVKVGVFVDEQRETVFEIASRLGLDVLQFHGNESPSYCRFFTGKFKLVKALFPHDRPYKEKVSRYKVDAYLFDIKYEMKTKGVKTLSADAYKEISSLIKEKRRVIISGGLNATNIIKVKKLKPYAVDVASGVEKLVGKKDKELMQKLIGRAKQ